MQEGTRIYFPPKPFKLRDDTTIIIRQGGLKPTDGLQAAHVHLTSFNECYIAFPENSAAMAIVTDHFKDKTIDGYTKFWNDEIAAAQDPNNHHMVLVAETQMRINGVLRDVIVGVINIMPVPDYVWESIKGSIPEGIRQQERWIDFDLIHLDRAFRTQGLGERFLVETARHYLNEGKFDHMILKAFHGNASPAWFTKNGFEDIGTMPIPYGGRDDINWVVTILKDLRTLAHLHIGSETIFTIQDDRECCPTTLLNAAPRASSMLHFDSKHVSTRHVNTR